MVLEYEHRLLRILHQAESLMYDLHKLAQECDGNDSLDTIKRVAQGMADGLGEATLVARRFFYG